jgi:hypothetical protein
MSTKLFIYDGSVRSGAEAFAKLIGHSGAKKVEVNSWKQLRAKICQYKRLSSLIILAHGPDLQIGGEIRGLGSEKIKKLFADCKTKIDRIEFEGCWIGEKPRDMADFASLFSAKSASGFTWASATAPLDVTLPKGVSQKGVRAAFKPYSRYLIKPDYGKLAALAKRRDKKVRLWMHWFNPDADEKLPPLGEDAYLSKNYRPRGAATEVTVTAAGAKNVTKPSTPFQLVTVTLKQSKTP